KVVIKDLHQNVANLNQNVSDLTASNEEKTQVIAKQIADDFVTVCDRQCRGQATTLSVVDLAELQATIPEELKQFSIGTNELIQNKEYKTVTTARGKTREFAQQSKIDQVDLVDFAKNLGTSEGKSLAKALQSAVKYNKTGGGITHAYGLSIYFPYHKANKVNQMVSTYQAIGMEEEYTKCIQEFASLEVSGQVSAGTSLSGYGTNLNASPDLLGSLLGQGGGYSSYSSGGLEPLLGGLYGGSGSSSGSTGSILDLFMGRSMTAENAAEYIMENHFDADELKWENGRIELSRQNWSMTESVMKNVFVDDGSGFIDLGCDAQYVTEGDALIDDFEGTWLSLDGNIMPYYTLGTVEYDNDEFVMYGYAPALLNDVRVNLIIEFINGEDGYIAGAQYVYDDMESDTQAKMMIRIGQGDKIQFVCDYYDYDGNYHDSYKLGSAFTLGDTYLIGDAHFKKNFRVTYCFTDIYQKRYWTPSVQWNEN
ncbi:MAG: peptidase C11, partial [Clostridia bacterium]|nr:peptidase C11 [Clostridia bacterium]